MPFPSESTESSHSLARRRWLSQHLPQGAWRWPATRFLGRLRRPARRRSVQPLSLTPQKVTWVDRLPPKIRPYLYLTRVDKPIGTLLDRHRRRPCSPHRLSSEASWRRTVRLPHSQCTGTCSLAKHTRDAGRRVLHCALPRRPVRGRRPTLVMCEGVLRPRFVDGA